MIKLFKVCGFLRQSLKSPSAEGEMLHALKTGGAPADGFKGVKSSLQGRAALAVFRRKMEAEAEKQELQLAEGKCFCSFTL